VEWVHETIDQHVLRSTMGLKWRCRNSSCQSFTRRPVPVGKMLLRIGGNGEGGVLMLTEGETHRGSCRENQAAAKYRLRGRSSSRRWLGKRKAEIEWGNGVWGEARCRFIGASGGGRAAISRLGMNTIYWRLKKRSWGMWAKRSFGPATETVFRF
jgi:hypothetical protein